MKKKSKILICIGTIGSPTFNKCYNNVIIAKNNFSEECDLHIIKNKFPQSEWLNCMRDAALGWDWCFQVDEDMYLQESAFERLYSFAIHKSKNNKILNASSMLYDLFLEQKVGSFKIWNSAAFKNFKFNNVMGCDRDIFFRASKEGFLNVSTTEVLGLHDSAPNKDIAYKKYFEYIQKIKKFDKNLDRAKDVLNNLYQIKNLRKDFVSLYAYKGALDGLSAKIINESKKG